MSNPETPPAARVAAPNAILDRGYGKPKEAMDANVHTSFESIVLEAWGKIPPQRAIIEALPEPERTDH
jgi:hypothetical protein